MEAFPTWAHLTQVRFTGVELQDVAHGKGLGLVVAAGSGLEESPVGLGERKSAVLRVPHDLVLSAEAVDAFAKVDDNFKQLLEAVGRKSTRGDILLYLVSHLAQSRSAGGLTTTPWTQYIRFLPRPVPVPTMWTYKERRLLTGTSLEAALSAKFATLQKEFDLLHASSETLPFWNTLFWANDTIHLEDWLLVDAWYRSRCLELPNLGTAMVPALDMVNHSSQASAFYEVDDAEDVVLLVRPGVSLSEGKEITISYGEAKSASEMLFNYGFVDLTNAGSTMTLQLYPPPDDPLARAKVHIFEGAKVIRLSFKTDNETGEEGGGGEGEGEMRRCTWHSPFVYLVCLNEEDGLSFRLLQDTDGSRNLRLFWQNQDVTERADDFEALIKDHKLYQVFRLRAVTVVLQTVEKQLESIQDGQSDAELELEQTVGDSRPDCIAAAKSLQNVEKQVLTKAREALYQERDALLADEQVVAYLQSAAEGSDSEEVDFS
ncbi:hypothetical protein E4U21_001671 [Claviceps maximensis]|nr:hypothetical protein E4U21_001671 [Claviceps maximensis]